MINNPNAWYEFAGRAISRELQTWQKNMSTVCRQVNSQSRFSSTEAPWIRQLAWLNYSLSGAMLTPKLALPAYMSMTVANLIAEDMQQRYKDDAKLTNAFLSQNYKGVLNNYISLIDNIERSFFTHPATQKTALSIQRKLRDIALSSAASWMREDSVDTETGEFNKEKAINHLRGVISGAGVLPTDLNTLEREFVEQRFAAIYEAIYAIV